MIIVKFQRLILFALTLSCLFASTQRVTAQSRDQSLPTAVLANEINGKIAPLDLGDSRLTRHFYAFQGVPGDLQIALNTRNLNGDMDVFTAVNFRPLMKISIYANTIPPEVTKSIYLRTRQILILRIEARTPNDDAGNYRITFGGAFEPFSGGIPVAENTEPSSDTERTGNRGKNLLSSVGARIEQPAQISPPPEEAKPAAETATDKPAAASKSSATKSSSAKSTRSTPAPRTPRGRTPRASQPRPAADTESAKKSGAAEGAAEKPKKETVGEGEEKTVGKAAASNKEKPAAQETVVPQPGAHLIIEMKDGTRIDRPMSTVRRVVVEGGTIVVLLRTGRTERIPMTSVSKMSIEP